MRRFSCVMIILAMFTAKAECAPVLSQTLQHETSKCLARSALKQYAPYLKDGLKEAMKGNWKFIRNAYDEKEDWHEALSRTAVDFAGYTVTPVLVDGVLAISDSQFAVTMKEAELGIFCWDAGKEFFSYVKGDTTRDDFYDAMMEIAVNHAEEASVKILGYAISSAGGTLIAPVVVIAGEFAIQRLRDWYEFKRWKDTVYVEDIRAILGDDLVREFTIMTPETHYTLAEPEGHYTLAEPETRPTIAQP